MKSGPNQRERFLKSKEKLTTQTSFFHGHNSAYK